MRVAAQRWKPSYLHYGLMLVSLGLTLYLFFWQLLPRWLSSRTQVQNHALLETYVKALESYYERNQRFPAALQQVSSSDDLTASPRDAWGNPLHYDSNGSAFVLVSFGQGGEPDVGQFARIGYLKDFLIDFDICGNFPADEVVSNLGWHTRCLE